jgi:hypothetical protein
MSTNYVGDVETDEIESIAPEGNPITSDTGLTVAFKFGKTSAREARFRSASGEAISAFHPLTTSGYNREWIIKAGDRVIATFQSYEVIGIWATGDADTKAIKD